MRARTRLQGTHERTHMRCAAVRPRSVRAQRADAAPSTSGWIASASAGGSTRLHRHDSSAASAVAADGCARTRAPSRLAASAMRLPVCGATVRSPAPSRARATRRSARLGAAMLSTTPTPRLSTRWPHCTWSLQRSTGMMSCATPDASARPVVPAPPWCTTSCALSNSHACGASGQNRTRGSATSAASGCGGSCCCCCCCCCCAAAGPQPGGSPFQPVSTSTLYVSPSRSVRMMSPSSASPASIMLPNVTTASGRESRKGGAAAAPCCWLGGAATRNAVCVANATSVASSPGGASGPSDAASSPDSQKPHGSAHGG